MANRSKKVVLSARVDPYLKAALELLATSRNEKIVKILETCVENGLSERTIPNPFRPKDSSQTRISFMIAFTSIWTENDVLYKLRAGCLGPDFAGEELAMIAMFVTMTGHFVGHDDVFGDLNGQAEIYGFKVHKRPMVNISLVEDEWPIIEEYVKFLANNKPFEPGYDDYKKMRNTRGG